MKDASGPKDPQQIIVRGGKPPRTPLRVMQVDIPEPDAIPDLDNEQLYAADFMVRQEHAFLFSDPGAGKTLTALEGVALIEDHQLTSKPAKVLILCPNVAVYTWLRWTAAVYQDMGRPCFIQYIDTGNTPVTPQTTHVVVPFGLLSRKNNLPETLTRWAADVLIIDECDNLSGWTSNRTQAVFGEDFAGGIAAASRWRWLMSGTPIPRYNDGLYPALRALFPERLKAYDVLDKRDFLNTFTTVQRVKFGRMKLARETVTGSRNSRLLHTLLYGDDKESPIAIRNKLVLKDKPIFKDITLDFKLSDRLTKLEESLSGGLADYSDMDGARVIDEKLGLALHQLGQECAPHIAEHITYLLGKKRASGDGKGAVVLFWHRSVRDILWDVFEDAGFCVGLIDGTTKVQTDAKVERNFNAGKLDIVLGQIKAMGVAINLQENCDVVAFAEDSFSDAANQQAYQRVWRRGQKHPVTVYNYVALQSSINDVRLKTAMKKRAEAKKVLDK